MKDKAYWQKRLNTLFNEQKLCVIATQGANGPYTSLVGFYASKDLRHLYFATTKQTTKYRNLENDENVSILIDDRHNQQDDFHKSMAVTAIGKAAPTKDRELTKTYLEKLPHLESFVKAPTCQLVHVTVEKYFIVTRFQSVVEMQMT